MGKITSTKDEIDLGGGVRNLNVITAGCRKDPDSEITERVLRGCKKILENSPQYGIPIHSNSTLYQFRTPPFPPNVPSYRVMYSFDPVNEPDVVKLIAIQALPIQKGVAF